MRILHGRTIASIAAVFCISLFAGSGNLYGQAASITGHVSDPSGAGVPGAQVTLKNNGTSATQNVNTDGQGRYTFADLGIGTYDLSATKSGFQTTTRTGVNVSVGASLVIDVTLAVGQTNQSVDVSAEAAQVETTDASVSSASQPDSDARTAFERPRLGTTDPACAWRLHLPVGRKQRADFGRQRLLDRGYAP